MPNYTFKLKGDPTDRTYSIPFEETGTAGQLSSAIRTALDARGIPIPGCDPECTRPLLRCGGTSAEDMDVPVKAAGITPASMIEVGCRLPSSEFPELERNSDTARCPFVKGKEKRTEPVERPTLSLVEMEEVHPLAETRSLGLPNLDFFTEPLPDLAAIGANMAAFYAGGSEFDNWFEQQVVDAAAAGPHTFNRTCKIFADARKAWAVLKAPADLDSVKFGDPREIAADYSLFSQTPMTLRYGGDRWIPMYRGLAGTSPADRTTVGVIGDAGGELIPLTCAFVLADKEGQPAVGRSDAARWVHTYNAFIPDGLSHCRTLFQMAHDRLLSTEERLKIIARFHYWFGHVMPYKRGSASVGELLVSYLLRREGWRVKLAKQIDCLAFVTPDIERFEAFYRRLLIVKSGAADPAPHTDGHLLAWNACRGDRDGVTELLSRGASANSKEPTGYTALQLAAREGSTEIVRLLANRGADIHQIHPETGEDALMLACRRGHSDIVRFLMDQGASTAVSDTLANTPLHLAVRSRNCDTVEELLAGVSSCCGLSAKNRPNPLARDWRGNLPLHYAASNGDENIVNVLLVRKKREQLNVVNAAEMTPAACAIAHGRQSCVTVLLRAGANLHAGANPLAIAIRVGRLDLVRLLVERHRFDINAIQDRTTLVQFEHLARLGIFRFSESAATWHRFGYFDSPIMRENCLGVAVRSLRRDIVEYLLARGVSKRVSPYTNAEELLAEIIPDPFTAPDMAAITELLRR